MPFWWSRKAFLKLASIRNLVKNFLNFDPNFHGVVVFRFRFNFVSACFISPASWPALCHYNYISTARSLASFPNALHLIPPSPHLLPFTLRDITRNAINSMNEWTNEWMKHQSQRGKKNTLSPWHGDWHCFTVVARLAGILTGSQGQWARGFNLYLLSPAPSSVYSLLMQYRVTEDFFCWLPCFFLFASKTSSSANINWTCTRDITPGCPRLPTLHWHP